MKKFIMALTLALFSQFAGAVNSVEFNSAAEALAYVGAYQGQTKGFGTSLKVDDIYYNRTVYATWLANNPLPSRSGGKWNKAVRDGYWGTVLQHFKVRLPHMGAAEQFCNGMGAKMVRSVTNAKYRKFLRPMAVDQRDYRDNVYVGTMLLPQTPNGLNGNGDFIVYTKDTYENLYQSTGTAPVHPWETYDYWATRYGIVSDAQAVYYHNDPYRVSPICEWPFPQPVMW